MTSNFDLSDPLGQARLALLSAVVDGDAGLAFDIVTGLMSEGTAFDTVLFDVITPLQHEIGHRWAEGDFRIAEEHAATGAMETVVAMLAGSLEMPAHGPHVVVVCAEGDTHSLPARLVAAYLIYRGYRTTYLGSSIPAADLGAYLAEIEPQALVVSCAMVNRLSGARATIAAAHAAGVPVLVGGQGFGDDDGRALAMGADAWGADPTQVVEVLRGWAPDPVAAEHRTESLAGDVTALEAGRERIVHEATTAAMEQIGEPSPGATAVQAEMQLLFDAVVSGVLVGEPALVGAFSAHLGAIRGGIGPNRTRTLLEALRLAVTPVSADAGHHLALAEGEIP